MFIENQFYLSENNNFQLALDMTGLSEDELFGLVGRFSKASHRAGHYRGELVQYIDGSILIRHHFTKKKLWRSD